MLRQTPSGPTTSDDWWDPEEHVARRNVPVQKPTKPKPVWSLPAAVGKLSLDNEKYPALGEKIRLPPEPVAVKTIPIIPLESPLERSDPEPNSANSRKKISKKPVVDLDLLLAHSEKKAAKERKSFQPGGERLSSRKQGTGPLSVKVKDSKEATSAVNALDSSAPTKIRGKERETPKPKKPSAMKKAILQGREERKTAKACPDNPPDQSNTANCEELVAESSPQSDAPASLPSDGKTPLHTRKFATYCDQIITPEIDQLVSSILETLVFYQDRAYHTQDPTKFKKRFVCGLKDVWKKVELKELKLIILAPDVEVTDQPKGPDEILLRIRQAATERSIPVVFALKRRELAKKCHKPRTVSVVGVISYDVAAADVKKALQLAEEARQQYKQRLEPLSPVRETRENAESGLLEDVP